MVAVIIAEVGVDMTRFPTPAHFSSWARFAPGVKESAGRKKGNGSNGHGDRFLVRFLVIVWHLLGDDTARFNDLVPGYYDSRTNPERKKRNHFRELEALGYKATLQPAA